MSGSGRVRRYPVPTRIPGWCAAQIRPNMSSHSRRTRTTTGTGAGRVSTCRRRDPRHPEQACLAAGIGHQVPDPGLAHQPVRVHHRSAAGRWPLLRYRRRSRRSGEHRRLQDPQLPHRVGRAHPSRGVHQDPLAVRRGGRAERLGYRPHHLQYGRTGRGSEPQVLVGAPGGEHEQRPRLIVRPPGHVRPVARKQPDAHGPAPFGINRDPGRRQRLGVTVDGPG
jgi:hypothetical protein